MRIRRLSQGTINRIAAGEVVERPASAVKELAENALDAGSSQIDVVFRGGGKQLIRVTDNGFGMSAEELALAVERHATSKIPNDDLVRITTLGFRGEALPSIGSVARLAITTVPRSATDAHSISVVGGDVGIVKPAALNTGTEIEVRDLFYATPARLKFLKTDRSENAEALDVVRRLALAHPQVGFSFVTEEREWLRAPAGESTVARVERVMGRDFMDNSVAVQGGAEDITVEGFAGLPTFQRAQGTLQYAVVNGRPVKDKLIAGAIRGAYADVMPRGRFPAVVLFIACAADRVDVNVHPAKTEVRFRDPGFVRGLIVSAIRRALQQHGLKADTVAARATTEAFAARSPTPRWLPQWDGASPARESSFAEEVQVAFNMNMPQPASAAPISEEPAVRGRVLGVARAQLHGNYIVAQTDTGIVFVDQHAAHERIVYERMKRERAGKGIASQPLLVPQVVEVDGPSFASLLAVADVLREAGLLIEAFGNGAVLVREVPAALVGANFTALLREIADDAAELDAKAALEARLDHVLATLACHHSVRSGRALRAEEMDALLRELEITPNGGQCNHGRPTFIALSLADIERLFGRN
jgi:DNA mismatch repair protein MutL